MGTKEYIEWIDIAKGIGILLVIAGHTICLKISSPLYAFHMPLFFLLSGLVYNNDKYSKASAFFPTKTKQILKPWAIMWTISLLVCLIIPEWKEALSFKEIIKEFYTTNSNNVQNSSLWYLLCLYVMFILYFFINKIKRSTKTLLLFSIIAIFLPLLKYIEYGIDEYIISMPEKRLPFKLDTALVALVFFCIGSWYKNEIKNFIEKEKSWILLFLYIPFIYIIAYLNGWTNLNSYDFGHIFLLFYPIAFLGIAIVLSWSYKISNSQLKWIRSILIFYGKNSLIIFGLQSLYIRLYLFFFNKVTGLDMVLYANNPWYHQIDSFVVVAFILSPLTVFFFTFLRKKGLNIL